jgi:hypothetical protein
MARQKIHYSLMEVKKKTGISYPTLIKYARDFADQIPSVGTGRRRRYTAESIRAFRRLYGQSRPGRRPGEDWAKNSAAPGGASAPRQLQLAEEDRELLRSVLEALREVSDKLTSFSDIEGLKLDPESRDILK